MNKKYDWNKINAIVSFFSIIVTVSFAILTFKLQKETLILQKNDTNLQSQLDYLKNIFLEIRKEKLISQKIDSNTYKALFSMNEHLIILNNQFNLSKKIANRTNNLDSIEDYIQNIELFLGLKKIEVKIFNVLSENDSKNLLNSINDLLELLYIQIKNKKCIANENIWATSNEFFFDLIELSQRMTSNNNDINSMSFDKQFGVLSVKYLNPHFKFANNFKYFEKFRKLQSLKVLKGD